MGLGGDHRRAGRRRAGGRGDFGAIMLFATLWLTIVYAPLAHMVWASDGLLFRFGAIDFAGGTVVHINVGVAGLVGVAFAGPAHRPFEGGDAAAFAGADDGRRGFALGRLVRVQRGLLVLVSSGLSTAEAI